MKGKEHKLFIYPLIVNSRNLFPGQRPSFCRRQIFYRMEGKACKVCDRSAPLPFLLNILPGAKCVRRVCDDHNSSYCLLNLVFRLKECFFPLYNLKDAFVITDNASQIYGNNRFCSFRNCLFQLVIIHFIAVFCDIYQNNFCAHMDYRTCRCCISIGRSNDLIALSNPKKPQNGLFARSSGIQTYRLTCPAKFRNLFFKFFCPVVIQPLFNASTTPCTSFSEISGGENGMIFLSVILPSLLFFNKNKDLRFRKSSFVLYFILFLLFSFLSGFRSISSFSVQTVLFLSLHNIIVFSFLRSVLHTF